MFDRVQLMGGSRKCYSIEDEPVVCLRRGRDTRPVRNRMTRRVSLGTPR